MKKANIKLQLSKLTPSKLLALLYQMFKMMTGNLNFGMPAVPLPQVKTMADNLKIAIENAKEGGLNERQIRDGLILMAEDMLRTQADYVRSVCNGDAAKLGSSGFEMAKTPAPIGPISAPKTVNAITSDVSGNIDLKWSGSRGAKSYEVLQCSKDPGVPENWSIVDFTSKNRWTSAGNVPGTFTYFAIIAVGAAGKSGMSDFVRGLAA